MVGSGLKWGVVDNSGAEFDPTAVKCLRISNNELIHYHSLFRHGVDDKRRVQIPAKWRPSQPETS